MTTPTENPNTLAGVLDILPEVELTPTRRRDMVSAIKRLCEMMGGVPSSIPAAPTDLRPRLNALRPAFHDIGQKSFANLKSLLIAGLELAGVADRLHRGRARAHPAWAPLIRAIATDKRLACGLAAFTNWCAMTGIHPGDVTDGIVQRFLVWIETRTLCPKPTDIVCRVPRLWNEAAGVIDIWPQATLTLLSFRPPRQRQSWEDLSPEFRREADRYLESRAKPDLFDESPHAPRRPLSVQTLHLQSEQLRLAASVLVESGVDVERITSLADLVEPENFKMVLRYYHNRAKGKPNAFATSLASTLIQVARHYLACPDDQINHLKRLASKLPPVPFDLTPKNKELLLKLEVEEVRSRLLFLAEEQIAEVINKIREHRLPFVAAQVSIAIDLVLVAPLRPLNLCRLVWSRHLIEPEGPRGRSLLRIPAEETKTKKRELIFELPDEVADRLRWYRREILPRLGADVNGHLFVSRGGQPKSQETISQQITEAIARHVGIHMTPHQFRHFAACCYLEDHPEDFETVRALLGHSWSKTTLIYAGSQGRRASRAFGSYLFEERDKLKLVRAKSTRRKLNVQKKKAA